MHAVELFEYIYQGMRGVFFFTLFDYKSADNTKRKIIYICVD